MVYLPFEVVIQHICTMGLFLFTFLCRNRLARFVNKHASPVGIFLSPLCIELSIYMPCHQLSCAFMPREVHLHFRFLPFSPQRRKLHLLHVFAYEAIIFAHILVSLACAIEMQHNNENCSSIVVTNLDPASWATAYWPYR